MYSFNILNTHTKITVGCLRHSVVWQVRPLTNCSTGWITSPAVSTRKERVWSLCVQGFVAMECDHKTTQNLIKGARITAGGGLACNTCHCFLFYNNIMEGFFSCVLEVLTTNFLPGVDSSKLHTGYACRACTDRLLTLTSNLQNALPTWAPPAPTPNYAIKTMRSIMSCSILGNATNPCTHASPDVICPVLRLVRDRACQTRHSVGYLRHCNSLGCLCTEIN